MADLTFVIDNHEYESPGLDTLTMKERRLLYDLSGIVQEDFAREQDETEEQHTARVAKLTRIPGFMEALMSVAYWRGHPGLSRDQVQEIVDNTNFLQAIEKWGEENQDGDALPPAVTSEPDGSSPKGKLDDENGQRPTSGSDGESTSPEPGSTPASTGTTGSDTSSPRARELRSVI